MRILFMIVMMFAAIPAFACKITNFYGGENSYYLISPENRVLKEDLSFEQLKVEIKRHNCNIEDLKAKATFDLSKHSYSIINAKTNIRLSHDIYSEDKLNKFVKSLMERGVNFYDNGIKDASIGNDGNANL